MQLFAWQKLVPTQQKQLYELYTIQMSASMIEAVVYMKKAFVCITQAGAYTTEAILWTLHDTNGCSMIEAIVYMTEAIVCTTQAGASTTEAIVWTLHNTNKCLHDRSRCLHVRSNCPRDTSWCLHNKSNCLKFARHKASASMIEAGSYKTEAIVWTLHSKSRGVPIE